MSPLMLYLVLFVLTAGAFFALSQAVWHDRNGVDRRLRGEPESQRRITGRLSAVVQQAIDRWPVAPPGQSPTARKLSSTLTHAGFRGAQARVRFQLVRGSLMIGLTLVGGAIAISVSGSVLIIAAVGAVVGYAFPSLAIRRRATKRQRHIKAELPDVLALLVVSLEAGIGFAEVVKLVGREAERQKKVMGQELSATAAQMTAGRSLEDSLSDLGERTGVDEVKSLTSLAIQSERAGARMASALRASAELLTSQRRLAAEEAAHKTAVKMLLPLVLLILPALMLIVLGPAIIQIFRTFVSPG
jgi:tight adherence protein C